MASVRVRWFASLREQRGVQTEDIELRPGETLGALYARLVPTGPEGRLPVAFALNLDHTTADATPADGDEVSFLPPIGGG